MATNKYAVSLDPSMAIPTRDGVKGAVVVAEDSADAKAMLKAMHAGDVDAGWDNATYTAMAAGADLDGWSLRIVVTSPAGVVVADETVTGDSSNKTVDAISALMVTALNATDDIDGAAYNSSTNVLKVAETTDALGDHHVFAELYSPGSNVPIPGFIGTITDEGSSGSALTVAMAADSYTVPKVSAKFAEKFGG